MRHRMEWGQGERPPWWPEGEPWPPPRPHWRPPVAMFIRFVLAFILFLFVVQLALAGAIWLVARAFGVGGTFLEAVGAIGAAFVLFVVIAIGIATVVRSIRRTTSPLLDVMGAAERVADGDTSVRVTPRGQARVRRLVESFNAMVERLDRAGAQRRQLLSDVTHELRTPLSVIQGRLEGALDGVYARDDDQLRAVLDEARHMSRVLEDLRMLSLAEGGGLRLDRRPTALDEIVDAAIDARTAEVSHAGVTVRSTVPVDLPAVDADATRLREILDNLLSNAIRYTPPGGNVTVSADRDGTERVRVIVRDTGRGLREDERELIFERFHRDPGSPGSGLGLAIARSLVRAHGGEIEAESPGPDRGTTMRFTLRTAAE